jgi:hypothetical protein
MLGVIILRFKFMRFEMLSAIMLNTVMLSVVSPTRESFRFKKFYNVDNRTCPLR